jgi:hypothetical protein
MQILFIYEPAEEIGMPSGGKESREKRIGSQERLACQLLFSFGSADQVKKRFSPIHHSEKEIRAPVGIGKGIESICEVNPELLYMRGKPFEDPGFRAGLPLALLAIVDPVPQINPIVLTRVEQASGHAAILVQEAQGPATEPPDGERRSIFFNE